MSWRSEEDPEGASNLGRIALTCQIHLQELLKEEELQENAIKAREGFWASRQSAEFNLWCSKVGVYGEGLRAINVRLKDVPGIFELLKEFLLSLEHDLKELQQPDKAPERVVNTHNGMEDDAQSDSSSLSFISLSSSDESEAERDIHDAPSASEKRRATLRRHIEDTIDRLHGHAMQIDRAGAKHRRERIELYRQKEGPKWAYEAYKELANRAAKSYFPSASEAFRQRIGESFARRRIRFEYLAEHQKKRAVEVAIHQPQPSPTNVPSASKTTDKPTYVSNLMEADGDTFSQHVSHDQHTIYSATVNTKLDMQPQPKLQERAESVASVALRHPGFPPPPKLCGDGFQCPYCRLDFRAHEARKERWSQHVIQDFEPYFCTLEDCKAPFDVPNSFDGLLEHLQSHLEERYHIDMPDGKHEEFDETEFEHHLAQHGEISTEMESIMKKASRRKGPFLFESCPFCGGYPDVIEKLFSDSDTLEAQKALRKHIKQHMQDIALFLPPYREDILDEDDDLKSFAVTGQSANIEDFEDSEEFPEICGQKDCDCKSRGRSITDFLTDGLIAVASEDMDARTDLSTPMIPGDTDTDFWKELFPTSAVYDSSPVPNEYFLEDEHLRSFIVSLSPQSHDISPSISKIAETLSAYNPIEDSQAFQDCMSSLAVPETSMESNRPYPIAKSTCKWVFGHKKYLDWVAGRHTLLWISGRPSSGKSTLLNCLLTKHRINTNSGASDIVLSFSFRNNSDELQATRRDLYQSLLYQVLEQAPDTLPELIRTFEQRRKQSRETGEAWQWDPDVLRLFFVIAVSRICQCDQIWLFIDSLEVCSQEIVISLTGELEALIPPSSHSSTKAHMCLTCHSHMHLDRNQSLQIHPENENQDDMAMYIREQISKATLIATNIMAIIIEKANGIFTLAIFFVEKVLEFERKQVTAHIIEEEIESIGPVIELYHKLIAKRGSLSWSLETIYTIDEAITQLLIDEDAETWFQETLGQTPLSWAMERGYEVAANLLLDKGAGMEPEISPHATPTTPSTAVVAQDGVQPPLVQIYSVPRDSSDGLKTSNASPISIPTLHPTYNHFAQEYNPEQLGCSNNHMPDTMADVQAAVDQTSVPPKRLLEQVRSMMISRENKVAKQCFLCKTPFKTFQAKYRCKACGLIFDSECTAVISVHNFQRMQDQQEAGVITAREVLGSLISVPTMEVILPQANRMSRREWEVIKTIIEREPRARNNLKYLANLLKKEGIGYIYENEDELMDGSSSVRVCKRCFDVTSAPLLLPAFLSLSQQGIKDMFLKLGAFQQALFNNGIGTVHLRDARWAVYKQPDNHTKMDRYDDIQPYVHNRVKLQVPENTSDYVNASPIILTSPSHPNLPPLRYIAMQGPTEASIDHVWRMVAEQALSPAVIVQITSMIEFTTYMSTRYYPENKEPWNLNESNLWGDGWRAKLSKLSSEIDKNGTEKSKLLLHVYGEEEPRVVWHFLYKNWDHYSPFNLDDLDSFVEVIKLSSQYNTPSSPRIIHCNTGVGRTSVFIALEHLIRELNSGALASYDLPRKGGDLVHETVEILRKQRHSMIQSESQYLFLYQAMKKLWLDKYGLMTEEGSGESAA